MERELPADRGAESRMGRWGTSWEESTGQTTQDASATSGADVFILRAVGSLRKVLSRSDVMNFGSYPPPSRNSRSGAQHTLDRRAWEGLEGPRAG